MMKLTWLIIPNSLYETEHGEALNFKIIPLSKWELARKLVKVKFTVWDDTGDHAKLFLF